MKHKGLTPGEMATEIVTTIKRNADCNDDQAIACANYMVETIRESHPMYIGNLNPKWDYFNQVRFELTKIKEVES